MATSDGAITRMAELALQAKWGRDYEGKDPVTAEDARLLWERYRELRMVHPDGFTGALRVALSEGFVRILGEEAADLNHALEAAITAAADRWDRARPLLERLAEVPCRRREPSCLERGLPAVCAGCAARAALEEPR